VNRLGRLLRGLRGNTSGVAMTEFALSLPFLMGVGMWGIESANLAITNMRVSQLAMQIADNGSRIGDTSTLTNHRIYESDVNDLLLGANIMGGDTIDLFERGRVIVSSLEVSEDGDQYIHWQRCKGKKDFSSAYGAEGAGLDGSLTGMGPPGDEVTAVENDAVIFVEISYDYQPLISSAFTNASTISATAAFNVRDDRDLSQIYQRDAGNPEAVAVCTTFDGYS